MHNVFKFIYIIACLNLGILMGQNPLTITFPNPTPNPSNLSVDTYTKALNKINLLPGFKYGFISGNATNLLNLSLGTYPNYVNPNYVGPNSNSTYYDCANSTIPDESKVVGETYGSFAVSSSGAATYNVPIVVSPGTRGVAPQLSIDYNSQGGLGFLGNSWNLTGISAITRVTQTPIQDGKFTGINLSTDDVYAIDGNRLFIKTGTYSLPGSTYYTEMESFSSITAFNQSGNGPSFFEVIDKNGNKYTYGNNIDSKLVGIGDQTVLVWYLSKFEDEFGNYMTYSYKILDGERVIDHIDYTGNLNAQLMPYCNIKFDYIDLTEKNSFYIGTKEFRKTKLLKVITSTSNNQLVKKYIFEYEWDNGTYLNSIREIDSNGNEYNPTTFCWGDPNDFGGIKNFQNTNIFQNPNDYLGMEAIPADFNGDGFTDYLCTYQPGARIRIMQNDFKSNYGNSSNPNNEINFSELSNNNNQVPASQALLFANTTDENLDNRQEVYAIFNDNYGLQFSPLQSKSYTIKRIEVNPNTNITTIGTFNTSSSFSPDFKPSQFFYDTKDYNGDGVSDELRIDPENIFLTTSIGTINLPIPTSLSAKSICRPINFNGDALTDFIILENINSSVVNIKVWSLNTNYVTQSFSLVYSNTINFPSNVGNSAKNMLRHFALGDYNGDGITDIVYLLDDFSELKICKGTGSVFLNPEKIGVYVIQQNSNNKIIDVYATDLNSDGKSDLILTDNSIQSQSSPTNNYFSYFSQGGFFTLGPSYSGNWTHTKVHEWITQFDYKGVTYQGGWDVSYNIVNGYQLKADLNGDGIVDITSFNSPNDDRTIANNLLNGKVKLSVLSIKTPFRKQIDISYANIISEIYVYSGGFKTEIYRKTIPSINAVLNNYKPYLNCVSHIKEFSGYNKQIVTGKKYIYKNAIFHSFGRGFIGFEELNTIDYLDPFSTFSTTKIGNVSRNGFNAIYSVPYPIENTTGKFTTSLQNGILHFDINTNKLISKTQNSISFIPRNSKGYFVSTNSVITKDYLKSQQSLINYQYGLNNGGNIISKTTNYGWQNNPVEKTIVETFNYILNNNSYKLNFSQVCQTQLNQPSYCRSTQINYDQQGHVLNIIGDPNLTIGSVISRFDNFNSFGSPLSYSLMASDIITRTNTVVYDQFGRDIIKKTNSLGNSEEFILEPLFGNIIVHKDISGLITKYEYDGSGKLIKSVSPNNIVNSIVYEWGDPGVTYPYSPNKFGIYTITRTFEGNGYIKEYYESNGQILRTESLDAFGQKVVSDVKYKLTTTFNSNQYPNGTLLETSEPHYLNSIKYSVQNFDYETEYFRPSINTMSFVASNVYSNSGVFNTISYNVPSTDLNYNPAFISNLNNLNQTVIRKSNTLGQIVSTINLSSLQQQSSVVDYNSNGLPNKITLTNNIDPNQSIVQSFVYNNIGQKIQMIDPSVGNVNYTYNSINELKSVSENNNLISYDYDVLGRLITKIGSTIGTITYQYVVNGNGIQNLEKTQGPNSITEYKYDNLNRLIEIKEGIGNKSFKTNYELDNFGRVKKHLYPSGFEIKNNYNSLGYLVDIKDANNNFIWQLISQDALGRIREYSYGNGVNTKLNFNEYNLLTEINHGNGAIYTQNYTYNNLSGNLISREINNYLTATNLKEVFNYDAIDRLKQFKQVDVNTNNQIQVTNTNFDHLGNIIQKDDAGTYLYTNPSLPYNVTQITNASNNISLNTLNITYNELKKVTQINESTTNKKMDFTYGNDEQRLKVDYSLNNINQYTRYYSIDYERQESGTNYKEWNYIKTPSGLGAIYYNNNGNGEINYVLTDHLGSPILLTNQAQQIVEEGSFDAWGRQRNPTDWSYSSNTNPQMMIRGYTMHEKIDEFGLLNMNGRLYDPVLGRFIQPDNFIQEPSNIQNFNRYSYVLNNPLKYNDPTGNEFKDLKGSFNLFFSDLFGHFHYNDPHAVNQASEIAFIYSQETAKNQVRMLGFVIGGGFGAIGNSIGVSGFFAGAVYGSITGAASGAITGALNGYIYGQDMKRSAALGAKKGAWQGAISGGLTHSERLTNFVRGQGFKTNDQVLSKFVINGQQQEALEYFHMEGTFEEFDPLGFDENGDIVYKYAGMTDAEGNIHYSQRAFNSYDELNYTFHKESFHSSRILTGNANLSEPAVEDATGFKKMSQMHGAWPSKSSSTYQSNYEYYNLQSGYQLPAWRNSWYDFIFRIPRRF